MRLRHPVLCLLAALVLVACGRQESTADRTPTAAPTTAPVSHKAASTAAVQRQKPAEAEGDLPSKITRINEDGSETVEEVPSDSGKHNPLLAAVASTVAATSATASAAAVTGSTPWQVGTDYTQLVPAQPTSAPPGQVEVLEFFWYACPHCYDLDPKVEAWKKTKPAYVTFSRVPVQWNEGHRALARLFYTLDSMGKLDQLHAEIFKEIHVNGDPLTTPDGNPVESERMQAAFVKKFGISEADFTKAYSSMAVDVAVQRADELVQRYRIDGVPRFVINGKYIADVKSAGTQERLLSLVGDLAAQEHKH
jgi:thiol:disulfide interchange protein DsbA